MSHTCDIITAEYINLGSPVRFWLSPSLQLPLHYRAPGPIPTCLTATPICVTSQSIFCPQAAAPAHSTPGNHVPTDIDGGRQKNLVSLTCYRCHQPGHKVPDCPLNFNIRLMTIEELEMELMVKKDMPKVRESPPDLEEVTESEEDFVQNDK